MVFMSYDFLIFSILFYLFYFVSNTPKLRQLVLLAGSVAFHIYFAGPAGILPVVAIGLITYVAALQPAIFFRYVAIALNVLALLFYKYIIFLVSSFGALFSASSAAGAGAFLSQSVLPAAPPLAISFFVFEFVHYLVEVNRGHPAIRSLPRFWQFAIFWPSLVAGPIKRYEPFMVSLDAAFASRPDKDAVMAGFLRVVLGVSKKMIADNLTAVLDNWSSRYEYQPAAVRWLFVAGLAARILLDFSGYSDIAIGYARMAGIVLPENFNWPYLATSLTDFWRRWHISLSSWIRDYVYVPLGGNRMGPGHRIFNAMVAFTLCGLWHGAGWNFALWGLWHGIGVSVNVAFVQLAQRAVFSSWLRSAAGMARARLARMDVAVLRDRRNALLKHGETDKKYVRMAIDYMQRDIKHAGTILHFANAWLEGGGRALLLRCFRWAAPAAGWCLTMLYVGIGWVLFFYPIDRAMFMIELLFREGL